MTAPCSEFVTWRKYCWPTAPAAQFGCTDPVSPPPRRKKTIDRIHDALVSLTDDMGTPFRRRNEALAIRECVKQLDDEIADAWASSAAEHHARVALLDRHSSLVRACREVLKETTGRELTPGERKIFEALLVVEGVVIDDCGCYCSDRVSGGVPCPPGKCPNNPSKTRTA